MIVRFAAGSFAQWQHGWQKLVAGAGLALLIRPTKLPDLNSFNLLWAKFKAALRGVRPHSDKLTLAISNPVNCILGR
jgi:hypothetical protein